MNIKNDWKINDGVSGLKIEVTEGEALGRLHIENLHASDGVVANRDFFFTKDGEFDGTGSAIKTLLKTEALVIKPENRELYELGQMLTATTRKDADRIKSIIMRLKELLKPPSVREPVDEKRRNRQGDNQV